MSSWIAGFLLLVFLSSRCNAGTRCQQNETRKWVDKLDNGLNSVQGYLFAQNESTACDLSENRYNAVYGIVFGIFVLVGIVFTFFGYHFFKLILFLTGFISVFVFVFYVAYNNIPCSWNFDYLDLIAFGIAATAGVIVGILAVCVFYFGIVMIGFALGCVAALAFLSFVHISYVEDHSWLPIVIIVVLGVIGAIIALLIQKPLIILSTCLVGGYLIVMGLDYFVENMQAFLYAWNLLDRRTKPNFPNCPATWVVLSLWPILALCGLIIQGKFTGKGDHHKRKKKRRSGDIEMDGCYGGNEPLLSD